MRQRKALHIVGTPKAELQHFEAELAEEENRNLVQQGPEARLVAHPDGEGGEKSLLCRSQARSEKEKAMLERQMNRLTEELCKIDAALRKSKKKERDAGKVERRIGRWLGRNPAASTLLEVVVIKDKKQRAIGLQVSSSLEKGVKSDLTKGAYLLRTNCTETDPAKLWRWYMQLTQAQAAFRTAKSEAWECPSVGTLKNGGKTQGRCRGVAGALGTQSAKPFKNGAKCSGERQLKNTASRSKSIIKILNCGSRVASALVPAKDTPTASNQKPSTLLWVPFASASRRFGGKIDFYPSALKEHSLSEKAILFSHC